MNLLLLNIPKDIAGSIKNSLSPYHLEFKNEITKAAPALVHQIVETSQDALIFFYTDQPADIIKERIGGRLKASCNSAVILILTASLNEQSTQYLDTGAIAVIHESEIGNKSFLEKILPVYHSLIQQQMLVHRDILNNISKAVQYFSHEIKNPLTNIDLSSSELRTEIPEDNKLANKFLYFIEKNCLRINEMLTDSVSLMEVQPVNRKQLELNLFFKEIGEYFKKEFINKGIIYTATAFLKPVLADKLFLTQLIVQLIKNAIDACPAGGGHIELTADHTPDGILICVQDNGHGITSDQLPLVFNPFYSVNSRSRGLGLSMAEDLVFRQGGKISIESDPGVKTCVNILIPSV